MIENKKRYVKPGFTMMYFNLSDSVATCPETTTYNEVWVDCIITQGHYIFYSNCSSNYSDLTIKTVTSAISFQSKTDAINYLSGSGNYNYGNGYTLAAGEYLVWQSGQWHAALITPDITKTVNSSL